MQRCCWTLVVLIGLEQLAAQSLGALDQHRLIDDEAGGPVGQLHGAPAAPTASQADVRGEAANSIPSGASTRHIS